MIAIKLQKAFKDNAHPFNLDVNLEINTGQIIGLYGPSGAGKTSILRIISGLETADQGNIIYQSNTWLSTKNGVNVKPQKRNIGYVFQEYALFPNMTVMGNLKFGMDKQHNDTAILDELIEITEIGKLLHLYPTSLSGGEKQRVALARALVRKPQLLLLDEPLSALDSAIRLRLQDFIVKVHNRFSLTTILVSHDIEEVYKLCDQVFSIKQGKVINSGSPHQLFVSNTPKEDFSLIGKIIKVEKEVSYTQLTISCQGKIFTIRREENIEYKAGDKISLNTSLTDTLLESLNPYNQ